MKVHEFVQSGQERWKELERFIQQASRLALARVPLDEFQRGNRVYRETIADLAYARMRFPGHPVVSELERLLGQAHSVIYQARRGSREQWWVFWTRTWPVLVRQQAAPILFATLVFWAAAALGLLLALTFPQLESFFVSPGMREAMAKGELWTQSITSMAPQATSAIATNNITVSLLCWALGIAFGLGTLWLLVVNGLMLGVIFAACLRAGMDRPLAEFIVAHGSLELPAIWIASGAGLVLGQALVFPGRYRRSVEVRLAARRSVQLVVGTIPMLLIAAVVEGFVSPSDMPGSFKAALGVVLAAAYLTYIIAGARRRAIDTAP